MPHSVSDLTTPLPKLTEIGPYTYGTTRLGDESLAFDDRFAIARAAIDAGVWLHTSHSYGDALQVLRAAFDQQPDAVPPAFFKIGWDSVDQVRDVIHQNIEPLGLTRMAVGQLCLGGGLAEAFRTGGPECAGLRGLKDEGLVGNYVIEVWPWNSDVIAEGLKNGHGDGWIDGYIFYFNPLQRFASDELWDLILERGEKIVAMRTVAGGSVTRLRDSEHAPEYLKKRAAEVAPLYERSGCATWPEFCIRYVFGVPSVLSSVGATARLENLHEFLDAAKSREPLPSDLQEELAAMQRRWAHEHDRHAKPWSM